MFFGAAHILKLMSDRVYVDRDTCNCKPFFCFLFSNNGRLKLKCDLAVPM